MTLDDLAVQGADVSEGLARCMGNEELYLRLVKTALEDDKFQALEEAVAADDRTAGFEASHALKGVLANLSLTPLSEPMSEICELFRARADADYATLMSQISLTRKELLTL